MKSITKKELNQLAQQRFGETASCEHQRSNPKGWYLLRGEETVFLGSNAEEAFQALEQLEISTPPSASPTSDRSEDITPAEQFLEVLITTFPQAFFSDPQQVKPLQTYAHKAILRPGISYNKRLKIIQLGSLKLKVKLEKRFLGVLFWSKQPYKSSVRKWRIPPLIRKY